MYNFIYENADEILKKAVDSNYSGFNTKFMIGEYRFIVLGEGTFGIVLKVFYKDQIFIAKIMKKEDDEPQKIIKLMKKIRSIKSTEIQKLIKKYITTIHDVNLKTHPQVIIFEYLEGKDLNDYLQIEDELSDQDFYFLITKIIMAVSLLHNKLRISHRDLKPQNIFYNSETKKLKLIDFGFSCFLNDNSCYNRYQGTSNYIHPRMNNKKLNNLSGGSMRNVKTKKGPKNNQNSNNRIKSNKNNALARRFPKPRSQDIFSIIIIILNIYTYIDTKNDNSEDIKLGNFLKHFFSPSLKPKSRINKFRSRLEKKRLLFVNLRTLDQLQITNPVISALVKYIKDYWNLNENNFIVGRKDYSKEVMNQLLEISISQLSKKRKKIFRKEQSLVIN